MFWLLDEHQVGSKRRFLLEQEADETPEIFNPLRPSKTSDDGRTIQNLIQIEIDKHHSNTNDSNCSISSFT